MPNLILTKTNHHLGQVFDKITPAFGDSVATRESNNLRAKQPRETPAGPPTQNTSESMGGWLKRMAKTGTAALGHQWLAAGIPRFAGELAAEAAKVALDSGDPKAVAVGMAVITTMNVARNIKMWHDHATRSPERVHADNNAFAGLHGDDRADDARRAQAGRHRTVCMGLSTLGTLVPNAIGLAGAHVGLDKIGTEFGAMLARTCAHVSIRNAIYANGRDLLQSEFSFLESGTDNQTMHDMRASALMYAAGQFLTGIGMDLASTALTGKNAQEALGMSKQELTALRCFVRAMMNATPEGPDLNANMAVIGEKTAQRLAITPPRVQELNAEQVAALGNPAHGQVLTAAQSANLHQRLRPNQPVPPNSDLVGGQIDVVAKNALQHVKFSGPTVTGPNIFKCSNLQTAAHKFFEQSITREALLNSLVISLTALDFALSKTKHFADAADKSGVLQGLSMDRTAMVNGAAGVFFALAYPHIGALWQSFGPGRTKELQPRHQAPELQAQVAHLEMRAQTESVAHAATLQREVQLRGDLQTAQGNLRQAQNDLRQAQQDLRDAAPNLKTATDKVKQLEEDVKTLEGQLSGTQTELDETKGKLTGTKTELDETKGKLTGATTELSDTQTKLKTAKAALQEAQNEVKELKQQQTQLEAAVTTAEAEVSRTQKELTGVESRLETAEGQVNELTPQLAASQQEVADLKKQLQQLQSQLASTSTTVRPEQSGESSRSPQPIVPPGVDMQASIQQAMSETIQPRPPRSLRQMQDQARAATTAASSSATPPDLDALDRMLGIGGTTVDRSNPASVRSSLRGSRAPSRANSTNGDDQ